MRKFHASCWMTSREMPECPLRLPRCGPSNSVGGVVVLFRSSRRDWNSTNWIECGRGHADEARERIEVHFEVLSRKWMRDRMNVGTHFGSFAKVCIPLDEIIKQLTKTPKSACWCLGRWYG